MWKALTQDIGLKIAAVLLAIFVWVNVAERRPVELVVDLPIKYINTPANLTFAARPPEIAKARVRGTGLFARWRLKDIWLSMDLSAAEKGVVTHVLSPGEAVVPTDRDVTVLEIVEPKAIRLDLDQLGSKLLKVKPVLSGDLDPDKIIVTGPTAEPGQVMLSGAREVIAGLSAIPTVPVDVNQLAKRGRISARIDLSGLPPVAADVDAVMVSARIEPRKELGIPYVPLEAMGMLPSRVRFTPGTVDIVISGGASQVDSLDPRQARLAVDAAALPSGQFSLVPKIENGSLRFEVTRSGRRDGYAVEVPAVFEPRLRFDVISVAPEELELVVR